jgi:outer membrane protein assembly factor BamB
MRYAAIAVFLALVFPVTTVADWPQFGGGPSRNHVSDVKDLPKEWRPGKFDRRTGAWLHETAKNVKWTVRLGSQSYGTPVVADGRIFVGTNNASGYVARYPSDIDLGVLLCIREGDGAILWQFSGEKLPTGRVHDMPQQGIISAPLVEKDRAWFVSNRAEIVCVDTHGFYDDEDDGPIKDEPVGSVEADVVWRYDLRKELKVSPHNASTCSVTAWGDTLFVCTGNGVNESHREIPSPDAPSFIALDKHTAKIRWTSNLPGKNIHYGQWSSPAVGLLGGMAQVIFCGGDGWVYSFDAEAKDCRLLWKFDTNAKASKIVLGGIGRGNRNEPIGVPVIYDGRVHVTTGQDPEHGEGLGCIWCIDPAKKLDGGDVSSHLVVDGEGRRAPQRREIAVLDGERIVPNPDSAAVWKYTGEDRDKDGKLSFHEEMHRTVTSVVIHDNLLFCADFSGLFHCLDARTGKCHWTSDLLAATWATPLIADGRVFVPDEDGDVAIFNLSADPLAAGNEEHADKDDPRIKFFMPASSIPMPNSIYCAPVAANGVLYITCKDRLFAVAAEKK